MNHQKTIVVVADTDVIIARTFLKDLKHDEVRRIFDRLTSLNAEILYPITAIAEAISFIQRVLGNSYAAYETAKLFTHNDIAKIDIDYEIYSNAFTKYFGPAISKKNTLFDCIVAAVADKYQADAIFSFDSFYKKRGFELASEL